MKEIYYQILDEENISKRSQDLISNGAYEVPYELDKSKLLEIIGKFLDKNSRAGEMLGWDIFYLIYKSVVVSSHFYHIHQGVLAILEHKDIKERWEIILNQVIPAHPLLEKLKEIKVNSTFIFSELFGSKVLSFKVTGEIRKVLTHYLVENYSYEAHFVIDNYSIWKKSIAINSKGRYESELDTFLVSPRGSYYSFNNKYLLFIRTFLEVHETCISTNTLYDYLKNKGIVVHIEGPDSVYINYSYLDKTYSLETFNYSTESIPFKYNNESRLGILCYGEPGTGKTCWAYSFYEYELRPLGFILIVTSYKEYLDLYFPSPIKVCILINDADYIENPDSRASVLSKLENSMGCSHIVTIFTVNSIAHFDTALMRKGRLDHHLSFTTPQI